MQKNLNHFVDRDFSEIFKYFKKNIALFIIVGIVFMAIAFVYNKIAIPRYKITSQILIKAEDQNQRQSLSNVMNFSILGDNTNFNNELLKIKTIPFIEQVIENLNIEVCYFDKGTFKYTELYHDSPIKVIYVSDHPQLLGLMFELQILNSKEYILTAKGNDIYTYNYSLRKHLTSMPEINITKRGKFGDLIETNVFSFVIKLDRHPSFGKDKIYFNFSSINDLALSYQKSLNIEPINDKVTSGIITYEDSNSDKGTDIINTLCNVYIDEDLKKRNHLANVTIQYIDKLLGEVSDSLSNSEKELQRIKSSNQIFDVGQQSTAINQQMIELDKQKSDIRTRIRYYNYVKAHLNDNKSLNDLLIPSSIGINDLTLSNLITELSNLTTERNSYIDNNQEKNPQLKIILSKIESIKNSIYGNINYILKTLEINESEMQSQSNKLSAEISKMPVTQRQMLVFERKFKLNDAIFTFLQERRAEANITMASNISNIEILEPAVDLGKVFPKKGQNYIFAFILALVLPVVISSIYSRFRITFAGVDEVSKLTTFPILGKLLHSHKKDQWTVSESSNTPYIESMRSLRTNLDYFIRNTTRQVILISSTSENEGKSFTALNLASGFALLRKKTLLLCFDLRKPTQYLGLDATNMIGITSYYIGKATLDDIIIKTDNDRLDIIPAGNIPPNPSELIELDKTRDIFNTLKNMYDYIIVDSPPLYYFTDAFLLMKHSDIKLLVVRHNITKRNIFNTLIGNIEEKEISNVGIIYNDLPVEGDYKYGYKYYAQGNKKTRKKKKNVA